MAANTNVLFPVEVINRELDFRIWLAVLYAHADCRIFIGQHDELFHLGTHLNGGIYLGKNLFRTAFPTDLGRYRALKERGFTLVHLDEEGMAAGFDEASFERYLAWRLDASCLAKDDYVCTWGDRQRDFYRRAHPSPENVHTTGHPRFDLYKPDHRAYYDGEVAELRGRYGDFVLINTNLSHANNGQGIAHTFSASDWYDHNDVDARLNHFNGWALQTHFLCNIVKLVNDVAVRWPSRSIVVRPHPGEDWSYYSSVFYGLPNVHVVHERPVGPWLFASSVLIHHACTTAVEGHFADIRIIDYDSFRPEVPWKDWSPLPDCFGARCFTEKEVFHYLEEPSSPELRAARLTKQEHGLLANFATTSFDKVIAVMKEAESKLPSTRRGDDGKVRTSVRARTLQASAKRVVRPLFPEKQRAYEFFTRNCFWGFDESEIGRKIDAVTRLTGKRAKWSLLSSDLLCIEAA